MERHEISAETEKLKNLLDKEEKVLFDVGITEFEKRKEEYEMIKYSMETACLESDLKIRAQTGPDRSENDRKTGPDRMKTGPDRFLVGPDRSGIFEISETFRTG